MISVGVTSPFHQQLGSVGGEGVVGKRVITTPTMVGSVPAREQDSIALARTAGQGNKLAIGSVGAGPNCTGRKVRELGLFAAKDGDSPKVGRAGAKVRHRYRPVVGHPACDIRGAIECRYGRDFRLFRSAVSGEQREFDLWARPAHRV